MLNLANSFASTGSSLKVTFHTGSLGDVAQRLPTFERARSVNERVDWIMRMPLPGEALEQRIPVATVSSDYVLLQHLDVVAAVTDALERARIPPGDVEAELCTTEFGE